MEISFVDIIKTIIPVNDRSKVGNIKKFFLSSIKKTGTLCPEEIDLWIQKINQLFYIFNQTNADELKIRVDNIKDKTDRPETLLSTESKTSDRHLNGKTKQPRNHMLFFWAILLTTVIVEKEDNVQEFYSIYKKCFDVLELYPNSVQEDKAIERLYPPTQNEIKMQDEIKKWNDFLSDNDYEKSKESYYFVLCFTIYISMRSTYLSGPGKSNMAKSWHKYIIEFLNKKNKTSEENAYISDLFKNTLEPLGLVRNKIEPKLKTRFSRNFDDALGAFPKPRFYRNRIDIIDELLNNAFKESHCHVLFGTRGIGKSIIAEQYAYECATRLDIRPELQYEHIITVVYDGSLLSTILSLRCDENTFSDEVFSTKIKMMKKLTKNDRGEKQACLLIIDNFDFEEGAAAGNELLSKEFEELLKTGWHILFTSRNNLEDVYSHAIRETEVSSLSLEELRQLFFDVLGYDANQIVLPYQLDKLIESYLSYNTYLVTLAGALTKELLEDEKDKDKDKKEKKFKNIEEALNYILHAFDNSNVSEISTRIPGMGKINHGNYRNTLMGHFKTLFNLSSIKESKNKINLLSNLILLPLSGMDYSKFFDMAYNTKEKDCMKDVFEDLYDSNWVHYARGKIFLHPLVREMLIEELLLSHKYIYNFICSLNDQNQFYSFDMKLYDAIDVAEAICLVFKKKSEVNNKKAEKKSPKETKRMTNKAYFIEICLLISQLSSNLDIIHNFKKAYSYGTEAVRLLDEFTKTFPDLSVSEKNRIAKGYNESGYAILHYKDIGSSAVSRAQEAIKKADLLLTKPNLDHSVDYKQAKIYTRIQGNKGARLNAKGDYEEALKLHKEALSYREGLLQLCSEDDFDNLKEIKVLIASAYKACASDLYYIGKIQKNFDSLYESYIMHNAGIEHYVNVFGIEHYNTVIAYNRMLGSIILLLQHHFHQFSEKESPAKIILSGLQRMHIAAKVLCKVTVVNEIDHCLRNAIEIFGIAKKNHLLQPEMIDIFTSIIEYFINNDKTRELVKKHNINDVIQDLKKRKENKVDEKNNMSTL